MMAGAAAVRRSRERGSPWPEYWLNIAAAPSRSSAPETARSPGSSSGTRRMLNALTADIEGEVGTRRVKVRRLRHLRRMWSWLLLTGWIVLPLMPVLALGLSKLL